jgi:hypothetical protein
VVPALVTVFGRGDDAAVRHLAEKVADGDHGGEGGTRLRPNASGVPEAVAAGTG